MIKLNDTVKALREQYHKDVGEPHTKNPKRYAIYLEERIHDLYLDAEEKQNRELRESLRRERFHDKF